MREKKYMFAMTMLCITSYLLLCGFCSLKEAEAYTAGEIQEAIKPDDFKPIKTEPENSLAKYVTEVSGMKYEDSLYLVDECGRQDVSPFVIMGLVKRESDFVADALGAHGERGLGQLMENTAEPVAKNLGIEYVPDRMFEPKYNLRLTITQFAYLQNIYNKDVNKVLTAYNRGQQGLTNYIESKSSAYSDPAMSDYSVAVLKNAENFKEGFQKSNK